MTTKKFEQEINGKKFTITRTSNYGVTITKISRNESFAGKIYYSSLKEIISHYEEYKSIFEKINKYKMLE